MNDSNKQLEGSQLDNLKVPQVVSTLQVIDIVVGNGQTVKPGDKVTAHYTGALGSNGLIFQSSHDFKEPATFRLDQVIEGWAQGVPGMKVGGKRRLIIPAAMAYGARSPSPNIPANSDLVFDIELLKIN